MANYYKVLEVNERATQDEIKKSFRKLAQKYHPDKQGGDENKFRELNEAYEVLSDPDKRRAYDSSPFDSQGRKSYNNGPNPFGGQQDFSGFEDMFKDIFGNNPFHNPFQKHSQRKKQTAFSNLDNEIALDLTLEEAYSGTRKNIKIKRKIYCEPCGGFGTTMTQCTGCRGTGMKSQQQGFTIFSTTCNECRGSGSIKDSKNVCKVCNSLGCTMEDANLDLDLPPGSGHIEAPVRFSYPGKGNYFGTQKGNLNVNITLKKQNKFRQDGLDLITSQRVKFSQVLLSESIEVVLPNGTSTTFKLSPGFNLTESYRIKKLGMPQPGSSHRGDVLVNLQLDFPSNLTSTQKQILEELKNTGL